MARKNIMVKSTRWSKAVHLMVTRKQRDGESNCPHIPFKVKPAVNYFVQLGPTS
jgi:hypothetical protein